MDVVLALVGQCHVDDVGQAADVNTACCDISADQEAHVPVFEGLQASHHTLHVTRCVDTSAHGMPMCSWCSRAPLVAVQRPPDVPKLLSHSVQLVSHSVQSNKQTHRPLHRSTSSSIPCYALGKPYPAPEPYPTWARIPGMPTQLWQCHETARVQNPGPLVQGQGVAARTCSARRRSSMERCPASTTQE